MKYTVLVLVLACLCPQAQPVGPGNPNLSMMDFWVGQWNLSWTGGGGTNTVTKTLNSRVIVENFKATDGAMKGFEGTSISTFYEPDGRWHQAWADSNGGYFNFVGTMNYTTRIFTVGPIGSGNAASLYFRMKFHNITHDKFTWDWEKSSDGGQNWELVWRIHYDRLR